MKFYLFIFLNYNNAIFFTIYVFVWDREKTEVLLQHGRKDANSFIALLP